MGFSEQLKKARVSMGYTLKQLARILNTTGSFLLETEPVQNTCRPDPGSGNDLMASYGRLNERSKKAVDDLVALLLDLQEKSKE